MVKCLSKTSSARSSYPLYMFSCSHCASLFQFFMFQFWKSITCRVPPLLLLPLHSMSSLKRLQMCSGSICRSRICARPLFISVPWYAIFNYPCTSSAGLNFPDSSVFEAFHARHCKKWKTISRLTTITSFNSFTIFHIGNQCWRVVLIIFCSE